MIAPRDYQSRAVEQLRQAIKARKRRIILLSPTRSGKTMMGAMVVDGAVEKKKSVLWLADKRELVNQASDKLLDCGIHHSVLMSGIPYQPSLVNVASKDTLWSRRERVGMGGYDLIVIDEAHISSGKTVWAPVEANPNAVVIGLTATPAFPNGRGMGSHFEVIVQATTYTELKAGGWLVPTRVWAPDPPDLAGLKVSPKTGDYNTKDPRFEASMNTKVLVGDAYEHWMRWGEGRQTVIFATGVQHSKNIVAKFREMGVDAEHLDGETPTDLRDAILRQFKDRQFQVLSNVDVCSKGWDCPPCSCCIIARPTSSLVWWRQATARIQTKHEGKTEAVLIDMTGSIFKHGFPDDDIEWPLDPAHRVQDVLNEQNGNQAKTVVCPKCLSIRKPSKKCPECGHESRARQSAPSKTQHIEGNLCEVDRTAIGNQKQGDDQAKWNKALAFAAHRGQSVKVAMAIFRRDTGHWPANSLNFMPEHHQNNMKVADLYPGFVRHKKETE